MPSRRQLLSGFSSLSFGVLVAGCTSDEDEDSQATPTESPGSTPTPTPTQTETPASPEFQLVDADYPQEVEINQEWSWSITVKNVGDEDGTFTSEIYWKYPGQDYQFLEEIELPYEAGEESPIQWPSWKLEYITSVTILIEEFDFEFTVQSLTRTLESGESYRSPEDIVMTVNGVDLRSTYTYEGHSGEQQIEEAAEGRQWLFVYVEVENDSGSTEYIPLDSEFDFRVGNQQYEQEFISREVGEYEGGEVGPSVVREGWIAFDLPEDIEREELTVEHFDSDVFSEWGVRWTTLESVKQYETTDLNYPDEVEVDRPWTFEVSVETIGNSATTTTSDIFRSVGDSDFEHIGEIELSAEASGSTMIESDPISLDYITETTVLISELDRQFSLEPSAKDVTFNETYQNPDEIVTTVTEVDLRDSYTYIDSWGNETTEEADEGYQWAFVYVNSRNDGSESELLPRDSDFTIRVGDQQFESTNVWKDEGEYDGGEVSPGIVREGWIAYEIPDTLSIGDIQIEYLDSDFTGEFGAKWSSS